jgi:hypothetical protein
VLSHGFQMRSEAIPLEFVFYATANDLLCSEHDCTLLHKQGLCVVHNLVLDVHEHGTPQFVV